MLVDIDITVQFAARAIDAVRSVAAEEILPRYRSAVADSAGASQVSDSAGASQVSNSAGASQPRRKDDGSLVTEADLAAQRALVRRLQKLEAIPVLAEEMRHGEQAAIWERGGRFWCVDPLDGTKNFASGVPFFAISVALMQGTRPVFGTVYDPIADEAFYAVRGAGAWLNHRPLAVPAAGPRLAEAIAEVSLRRDSPELRAAIKKRPPYKRRLTSGSSTLSWCHLAAARIDVMLHSGQKMWDYSAGALILEEAGGFACTLDADDFWSSPAWSRSAIAARTAPLLAEWRDWIRGQR